MKNLKLATALSLLVFVAISATAQTRTPRRTVPRRARAEGSRPSQPPQTAAPARAETTQNFETLIAADSYAVYASLRSAGQFLRSGEFTQMLDSLRFLTSPKEARGLEEIVFFFVAQAEALNNTNVTLGVLAARDEVPAALVAFQFPSIEAAAAFEPKFRAFLTRQLPLSEAPPRGPAGKRRRAETARQPAGSQRRQGAKPQPSRFHLKRTGNVLIAAERSFTLKKLRGDGDYLLASDARFQSFRGRFADDPLFVYVEMGRLERGFAREREQREKQWEAERAAGVTTTTSTTTNGELTLTSPLEQPPELPPAADPTQIATTPAESGPPEPDPEPAVQPETADAAVGVTEEAGEPPATVAEGARVETAPPGPQADVLIPMLFGGMVRGNPRWPEAFGVALSFDKDDYVLRALMANPSGETVNIIPFLPTFTSGPATTLEASSVAPAETEIFANASIDWQQMYEALMKGLQQQQQSVATTGEEDVSAAEQQRPTPEDIIKLFEKAAGFKIREDLLPALGNEVSVSVPVAWFTGSAAGRQTRSAEAQEARAGAVLLLSLNNPEGMRKMLPRLLEAVGMKSPLDPGKTETRADIEINSYAGISAAFMNNYLALSNDPAALRHFVDGGQQTLISSQSFRNATGWQPRQKLGSVYVSPALMESLLADARKWLDPEDVELQNLFTQLNIQPSAATYAVTSEGGELLHELRLPKGILKILSAQMAVAAKNAALIQNEQSAMYHLRMVHSWQENFKTAEGKGKYGNLDDLIVPAAREGSWTPFSKSDLEQLSYKIEINTSGEKFQATATPKQYSKSARRSFFIDESGVLRGADHRGEPANANDPPVD
jgi:hypothetical protein